MIKENILGLCMGLVTSYVLGIFIALDINQKYMDGGKLASMAMFWPLFATIYLIRGFFSNLYEALGGK